MSNPRLYRDQHAPRCRVCHGPMVAVIRETTHATCDPSWRQLVALSDRAQAKKEAA